MRNLTDSAGPAAINKTQPRQAEPPLDKLGPMETAFQFITEAITVIFFLITVSYYYLLFKPRHLSPAEKKFTSLSVIIAAHNEARYIEACIKSAITADFDGEKEIIVVADGCTDDTVAIASRIAAVNSQITVISHEHKGKANSLNIAISRSRGELLAFLDGDGEVLKDTFVEMQKDVEQHNVVATTCPILVKNRHKHLLLFMHMEQLYASLLRSIMSKINANIVISGQCAMYRKKELLECGSFSPRGYCDDSDLAVRMIRHGYHLTFTDSTAAYTNMPDSLRALLGQRVRWCRGALDILVRHCRFNSSLLDLYSLPLLAFSYIQGTIMGSFTLYKIVSGYWTFYASHGEYLSWHSARFLIDWFSVLGLIRWSAGFFTGATPLDLINVLGAMASVFSYPLYILAIVKHDRKIDFLHLVALTFMSPFWWFISMVQIIALPEIFRKDQMNIWTKPAVKIQATIPEREKQLSGSF